MKRSSAIVAIVLPLFLGGSPMAARGAKSYHTKATLVADVAGIRPGETFTAGIILRMDPGWHTYWKNGGDAGLPTQIRWNLPPGFLAGEIQWPLPEKHIESGNLLTYGYSKETMLLVPVTPPAQIAPGSSVTLRATVHWLECEHVCVPGDAEVRLSLPVLTGSPAPAHAALFEKYRSFIPRPLSASSGLTLAAETAAHAAKIYLSPLSPNSLAPGSLPDFYPEPLPDLSVGRTHPTVSATGAVLEIPLSVFQKPAVALTLRGVLVYQLSGAPPASAVVEVPLSAEFCAALPAVGDTARGILDEEFNVAAPESSAGSLALYLVFGVIGGLLLNIMPCVLPVIALKIFGLVRMAGDHPERVKRLGWSFALGIIASFVVLALLVVVLKLAGQQVGWGFQFQEPMFVIAMCAVVFAFGLSLFGVYEIRLPGFAVAGVGNLLNKQVERGGSYGASFAEGVFATILATPCTAPFLGTALGFAFAQPAWIVFLVFLSVAAGMALPYLLLTARPAWLKYLPAPGSWMVAAKELLGFLMMATLIWLLYILGRQLGMESVIWTAAFLLAIGVACWLVGRFATLTASRLRNWSIWTAAILIVIMGYWFFLGSSLDVSAVIAGTSPAQVQAGKPGISWKPFTLSGLEADLNANKAVFIDFTADWCLTCKVNEATVMSDPSVIRKFQELHVTAIRADWTNRNPDITRLMAKFGRSGVPLYVIFPPGKQHTPTVLPEVITSGIVTGALDRAAAVQKSAEND